MNGDTFWLSIVKVVGVPGAVAAYFMIRDWLFMSESIKLQAQTVELLRQLVAK